jgi:hypothetical protein
LTATIDMARKRGDTRRITFIINESGAPVDISAWTSFKLTIDPNKAPPDASTKVEERVGVISSGGLDGRVHFIPTGTIEPGAYFYDAQALDSNAEKVTFSEGKYKVTQDITKV